MSNIELGCLNTLYRNFPGWFVEPQDTVKKAAKASEAKKPIIEPVKKQGDSAKERPVLDSYDKAGSDIRNELRVSGFYDKNGKKIMA